MVSTSYSIREAIRYGLGSVLTVFTNLMITAFCHEYLGLKEQTAFGIALVIAFFLSFYLMRYYIRRAQSGPFWKQLGGFFISALVFRLLEYLAFGLIYDAIGLHYLLTIILVNGTSFVLKFFYYRVLVFATSSSIDTAKTAKPQKESGQV